MAQKRPAVNSHGLPALDKTGVHLLQVNAAERREKPSLVLYASDLPFPE
jgi:hypothetical protein